MQRHINGAEHRGLKPRGVLGAALRNADHLAPGAPIATRSTAATRAPTATCSATPTATTHHFTGPHRGKAHRTLGGTRLQFVAVHRPLGAVVDHAQHLAPGVAQPPCCALDIVAPQLVPARHRHVNPHMIARLQNDDSTAAASSHYRKAEFGRPIATHGIE